MALEVLWPHAEQAGGGQSRAASCCWRDEGEFSALLTGDAESEVLEALQREGRLPDVDVLKVGHHGSSGCVTDAELDAMTPDVVAISVGEGNRFGHPTPARSHYSAGAACPWSEPTSGVTSGSIPAHGVRTARETESGDSRQAASRYERGTARRVERVWTPARWRARRWRRRRGGLQSTRG